MVRTFSSCCSQNGLISFTALSVKLGDSWLFKAHWELLIAWDYRSNKRISSLLIISELFVICWIILCPFSLLKYTLIKYNAPGKAFSFPLAPECWKLQEEVMRYSSHSLPPQLLALLLYPGSSKILATSEFCCLSCRCCRQPNRWPLWTWQPQTSFRRGEKI